jgi:hypothetical protein
MPASFAVLLLAAAASANPAADPLAAKLQRQTQALLDALVTGDKTVWDDLPARTGRARHWIHRAPRSWDIQWKREAGAT